MAPQHLDFPISALQLQALRAQADAGGPAWLETAPYPGIVKEMLRTWLFPVEAVKLYSGDVDADVSMSIAELETSIETLTAKSRQMAREVSISDPYELVRFEEKKNKLIDKWVATKRELSALRDTGRFKASVIAALETHLTPEQRDAFIATLEA